MWPIWSVTCGKLVSLQGRVACEDFGEKMSHDTN